MRKDDFQRKLENPACRRHTGNSFSRYVIFYIIYALFAMSCRKTYYLSGLVKKRAKNKAFYPVFAFLTLFPEIT